jgi:NAD(P)-dependent dehydrogenase (short-subunit alcohol dehydrogenase family)
MDLEARVAVVTGAGSGIDPAAVAEQVHDAVVNDRFWIRTHPEMEPMVAKRCEAIIAGEPPPPMLPTDIK